MKIFYLLFSLIIFVDLSAQVAVSVPSIHRSSREKSHSEPLNISTTGIVTAKISGKDRIGGFFIQDEVGDDNPATPDGIFVKCVEDVFIEIGEKITITATINTEEGIPILEQVSDIKIVSENNAVTPVKIKYGINNPNLSAYSGMLVEFDQTLWVNDNYYLARYGELELGVKRKLIPTNGAFPGTSEYAALVNENALSPIILDDGYSTSYKTPIVFADENGTRRMGERVDNLQGVLSYTNGNYVIVPSHSPVLFYGNPRKEQHDDIGNYNLKICGFNLEYYLTSSNNSSFGPSTPQELNRQHAKILDALLKIDADIYGLVEIEMGQDALKKLADAMNASTGTNNYTYVNDGSSVNGTYTKAGYLYRSDKVRPYNSIRHINSPSPYNRKKLQGFTHIITDERFMLSVNHFKAKSGCPGSGADADQGDGQGCFNAARAAEAEAVINSIHSNKSYFNDDDALVIGDLNAYAKEDPISRFTDADYTDLLHYFHGDSAYSYVYRDEAGYLDHALANESMLKQITGATVFHINSDEPSMFEYSESAFQPNMFRSSDHDPVIIGIALGQSSTENTVDEKVKIYPSVVNDYLHVKDATNFYIQLYALSGIKLYQSQINTNEFDLNIKNTVGLISGIYIVRVLGEGRIIYQLIVVK
ncbi:MAG: ExeM/NucH family extracellular endonuclease [Paludibacteraceae bacterium]